MTIFVTWQLRVTLDSIRNSCYVLKYSHGQQESESPLNHFNTKRILSRSGFWNNWSKQGFKDEFQNTIDEFYGLGFHWDQDRHTSVPPNTTWSFFDHIDVLYFWWSCCIWQSRRSKWLKWLLLLCRNRCCRANSPLSSSIRLNIYSIADKWDKQESQNCTCLYLRFLQYQTITRWLFN